MPQIHILWQPKYDLVGLIMIGPASAVLISEHSSLMSTAEAGLMIGQPNHILVATKYELVAYFDHGQKEYFASAIA